MDNNKFFSKLKIPKIYVYTTPSNKKDGYIKIGYTTRDDVTVRIDEQIANILIPKKEYEFLYEETAEYINKPNFYFNDKIVHNALKKKGFIPYKENGQESEWFKCDLEDVKQAIFEIKNNLKTDKKRINNYILRPEQLAAVNLTSTYFENYSKQQNLKAPHFLWNAKMRFGKTFSTYKLAEKMQWKKILILTYKPAVQNAWQNDLQEHIDFHNWTFKTSDDVNNNNITLNELQSDQPIVCFSSFQNILGEEGKKAKFNLFYDITWDCIVLDEYHYGSWKETAKDLYDYQESDLDELKIEDNDLLKSNHYLYLSGTPFRSLLVGEFTEDQIFNWTYADEQRQKEIWPTNHPEQIEHNPYLELPQIIMMTYKIPSALRESIESGDTEEFEEFDLNQFFKAKGKEKKSEFIHKKAVFKWLEMITGKNLRFEIEALKERNKERPPLPFEDIRLLTYLNHTLWYLPDVSSCFAMKNLIKESSLFKDYTVLVAAGNKAGMGAKALDPVMDAIYSRNPQHTKTITLTCGKLTTGVSVAPWTGIFMLRNLTSPESYFQAAFRVQTPWTMKDPINNKVEVLKEKCYVFDFSPNRALKLISDYCSSLDYESKLDPEHKVQEFLNFLPVLAYDGFEMQSLDARQLLDFVVSGTSSTMLAKKFQSTQLVNLNNFALEQLLANPKLLEDLNKIEAFRKLNDKIEKIISSEKLLKEKKKNKEKLTPTELKEKNKADNVKKQLRELLLKFITRLPIFMYLTDDREKCLKELITQIETDLFIKTTGITLETFEELCKINIFNVQSLNAAIFAFKKYEDSSLNYLGNSKQNTDIITGWDSTYTKEEVDEIIKEKSNY